ncbi:chaperonin 10-like protein, partial [Jimgerdemannia flammicorona]
MAPATRSPASTQTNNTHSRLDHIRNTMGANDTSNVLQGWACPGKDKPLELTELPLKTWTEDDVDIQVTHCGICGSDMHTLSSDWGPTPYPCVVGHEIVGVVTRVGANVKDIKVGDRAGVGAQVGSCLECD